jgi:hypothetical protein
MQQPPWPGNDENQRADGTEHNTFWQSAATDGPNTRWQYEGPRPWHEIFRDFLTMGGEDDCDYLINEPTADYSHAYRWYIVVSVVILVLAVILMLIFLPLLPDDAFENDSQTSPRFNNPNTTRQVETAEFAPENLITLYCIAGPIGILLNIIFYTGILFVIHTVATSAFQGTGDFEKLVYGIFTLNSAFSVAYFVAGIVLMPLVIVILLMSEALFVVVYCFLFIAVLGVTLYILYLYTLIVKTVHQLGWGGAIVSSIVAPIASIFILYCGCIFCFSVIANSG